MLLAENASDFEVRVATQVERIRASNLLGRSDPLHRLLVYLAGRAALSQVPKEFEIAHDVFSKDSSFDVGQDATIRVYVHRLRKKLEDFYIGNPSGSDRLRIPRGVYRLVLDTSEIDAGEPPTVPPVDAEILDGSLQSRKWGWIAACALVLSAVASAGAYSEYRWTRSGTLPQALAKTAIWQPFGITSLRSYFVVGDREVPGEQGAFLSSGSVTAVMRMTPVAAALAPGDPGIPVTNVTRMSPYMVKEDNVIYVGPISQIGMLGDFVFAGSGFSYDQATDALLDRASQRRFGPPPASAGDREVTTYGYLASLDGPSGNRILVVSGTGDGPLLQMAEIAIDPRQLDSLVAKAGPRFEALYAVTMLKEVNIGYHLVMVRKLGLPRP